MNSVQAVQNVQTVQNVPATCVSNPSDGLNDLNDLNGFNPYLGRGAFSQINLDHLRIFRDAGRRALGNLLPGAENYDAL